MNNKTLIFVLFLSVACMLPGLGRRDILTTTPWQEATFKFTAGDSTYVWNGDKKYSGQVGSGIEVNRMDSVQLLYVVYAAGGNGDRLMIAFVASGHTILRRRSNYKKAKVSIRVDAHLHESDWNNDDESDSTVQFSFTSFHNNMADGTFSGLVSSGKKKLAITGGEFYNVKVSYRSR